MLNIFLSGASGKVGKEIFNLCELEKKATVVGALRSDGKTESYDKKPKKQKPDVFIDFSRAEFFETVCDYCIKNKLPLVSGTTGFDKKQKEVLKQTSKKIPVLWASNMSLGVNTLHAILKNLKPLESYDFYIEETHHTHKKDSPSGTTLTLKENLEKVISKKTKDVLAMRGGGVFGQHRIIILGPEETLILEHNALNRTVFARGALRAAEWLAGQRPGLYSMEDVLK